MVLCKLHWCLCWSRLTLKDGRDTLSLQFACRVWSDRKNPTWYLPHKLSTNFLKQTKPSFKLWHKYIGRCKHWPKLSRIIRQYRNIHFGHSQTHVIFSLHSNDRWLRSLCLTRTTPAPDPFFSVSHIMRFFLCRTLYLVIDHIRNQYIQSTMKCTDHLVFASLSNRKTFNPSRRIF